MKLGGYSTVSWDTIVPELDRVSVCIKYNLQKEKGKANQLDVGNEKDQHNSGSQKKPQKDESKLQCQKATD